MERLKEPTKDPGGMVYVYQPGYGGGHPRSQRMFWDGCFLPDAPLLAGRIVRVSAGSSLLADCFNQGWTHALNMRGSWIAGNKARDAGLGLSANPHHPEKRSPDLLWKAWEFGWQGRESDRCDWFAMLHDDIAPDCGWLDMLWSDLRWHGADLVAAVVPLKEGSGVTSTAIDDPTDRFSVARRLTMAEVMTLPEVFSREDLPPVDGKPAGKLLANTGCWMVRLDLPFLTQKALDGTLRLRFRIDNEVVWDEGTHSWVPRVAPEDWEFSRDFSALGGKIACSRRIGLDHWGQMRFENRSAAWTSWAKDKMTAKDLEPINEASVPEPSEEEKDTDRIERHVHCPPTGWSKKYPDVRGWLTDPEGEFLARMAKGKNVLEIGSFCGLSTIWLSNAAAAVTAVDTFDGRGTSEQGKKTLEEFRSNLHRHGNPGIVGVQKVDSQEFKGDKVYDLAFVDGGHDFESVAGDIRVALKHLRPGGVLMFHDYGDERTPDVARAVDGLLLHGGAELVEAVGHTAAVRPTKDQVAGRKRQPALTS